MLPEGIGWELFNNYLIVKDKFKPDFFLYENNRSISPQIKAEISRNLGVKNVTINSSKVSAQSRWREYWYNWNCGIPADRNISLQDILDYGHTDRKKSKTIRIGGANNGWGDKHEWDMPNPDRTYTTSELEKLQTIPVGYTKSISKTQARKAIGNGWTAEVIIHILKSLNIPLNEEITVVSIYDGIGTGRYCFDKMGYKNITYYAFEIDKYVMRVANANYPDIIQCGDAFAVRDENWSL